LTTFKNLVVLSFTFFEDEYKQNLQKLLNGISKAPKNSIILAPELCLTNFSFYKMDEAVAFGESSLQEIKKVSQDKIVVFSLTTKKSGNYFNTATIIKNGAILHQQSKYKLFKLGDEHNYFTPGKKESIKIVEIDSIKFAILVCFEIRFIDLWQVVQGADIIMIPSLWGKLRKKQLEIITNAIAVINQSYVMVSNSKNSDMAASSAIISPFGDSYHNDNMDYIELSADMNNIKKMRRYIDIGL
jgi:predicted amidohydrolase